MQSRCIIPPCSFSVLVLVPGFSFRLVRVIYCYVFIRFYYSLLFLSLCLHLCDRLTVLCLPPCLLSTKPCLASSLPSCLACLSCPRVLSCPSYPLVCRSSTSPTSTSLPSTSLQATHPPALPSPTISSIDLTRHSALGTLLTYPFLRPTFSVAFLTSLCALFVSLSRVCVCVTVTVLLLVTEPSLLLPFLPLPCNYLSIPISVTFDISDIDSDSNVGEISF